MNELLENDGLTIEVLKQLSFSSHLKLSLKRSLRHFTQEALIEDALEALTWYRQVNILDLIKLDYRIKSIQSTKHKLMRLQNNTNIHVDQVFNDLLGLRTFCDDYKEILKYSDNSPYFKCADLSHGKSIDDGYRGVHLYFQLDHKHYPIEIQYNTYYDRQCNDWLHRFLYKKNYPLHIGVEMRKAYENGNITTLAEFEEVLNNVLFSCERF